MRIEVLGTPVDALSFAETVAAAQNAMTQRVLLHQVSLNVAKLVDMRTDHDLRDHVLAGSMISADGMGILWAARLLGQPLPGRVAGVDLMMAVLALCAEQGFRPYLLGASREVVRLAADAALKQWPGLALAGYRDGYFTEGEEATVVDDIRSSRADCLFVAMPTPRKESFMRYHRDALGVPFIMGVGGSFDILAGVTRRAPDWMQRVGIEWAYRCLQEPGRMIGRYARTHPIFVALLLKEIVARRVFGTSATVEALP